MKKIIALSSLCVSLCIVSCNKKDNTTAENKSTITDSVSTTPKDYQINSKTTCYLEVDKNTKYIDSTMISINENEGKITGKIFNKHRGADKKENSIITGSLSGIKTGDTLKVIHTLTSNGENTKNQGFYLQRNGYLYPASGTLVKKNGVDMLDTKTIKFGTRGYKTVDCKIVSKYLK